MKTNAKRASTLLAAGLGLLCLMPSPNAGANSSVSVWRHFAPSMCTAVAGFAAPAVDYIGRAYNPSTSAVSNWVCPVVNDSSLPYVYLPDNIAGLTYGENVQSAAMAQIWGSSPAGPTNSICAYDCRAYYGGGGGTCGPGACTGYESGNWALQWTPSAAWTGANPADSPFLSVSVNREYNSEYTTMFGYGFSYTATL
jgi:hypothetical protein